jgi:PTS system mannose-specific IIA component
MIAGLVITHGNLAIELVHSAKTIVSSDIPLFPVPLKWTDTWEEALKEVKTVLDKVKEYEQIMLFTDMYGGTPSNIAFSLAQPDRIAVLTGVNLPILVSFLSIQMEGLKDIQEVASFLIKRGKASIRRYREKE